MNRPPPKPKKKPKTCTLGVPFAFDLASLVTVAVFTLTTPRVAHWLHVFVPEFWEALYLGYGVLSAAFYVWGSVRFFRGAASLDCPCRACRWLTRAERERVADSPTLTWEKP